MFLLRSMITVQRSELLSEQSIFMVNATVKHIYVVLLQLYGEKQSFPLRRHIQHRCTCNLKLLCKSSKTVIPVYTRYMA